MHTLDYYNNKSEDRSLNSPLNRYKPDNNKKQYGYTNLKKVRRAGKKIKEGKGYEPRTTC